MAVAWLFTLPMAGIVGGISARIANTGTIGVIVVGIVLVGAATAMYVINRRNAVTAATVNDVDRQPAMASTRPEEEQTV